MNDLFDPDNQPDGPGNTSGTTNFDFNDGEFTLGDLINSFLPNDTNTFDNSVPFNLLDNNPSFPSNFPINPISNDINPFDILGYAGVGLFSIFGGDRLYPFDIYGFDRSVPFDVYDGGIVGSIGNDNLVGTAGNDVIYGNSGTDSIFGEAGNDTLIASSDGGFLSGGNGDDILYAGFGQTIMLGDSGRDIFVLSAATATSDPSLAHVLLDVNDTQFDSSNTGDTVNVANTESGALVNLLSGAEFNFVISGTDGRVISANDTAIVLDGGGFLGVVIGQTPSEVADRLVIT